MHNNPFLTTSILFLHLGLTPSDSVLSSLFSFCYIFPEITIDLSSFGKALFVPHHQDELGPRYLVLPGPMRGGMIDNQE